MGSIAILLGISNYIQANDLPACQNDVENMHRLLQATGKYNVLLLEQSLTKSQIMEKIEDFIKEINENEKIEELLFYFSGHGKQDQSGLHFILQNTEIDRINTTSLNNKELDDLVRQCNPHLFVKIIDACESGLSYIKGIEEETEIIEKQIWFNFNDNKSFENCVFMSSSKRNEPSKATDRCSLFTQAFISAVLDGIEEEVIRYSYIQDYITDTFNINGNGQTPYFNLQGDGRAIFSAVTPELKALAEFRTNATTISESENEIERKLESFITAFRSKQQVQQIVEKIESIIKQENLPLSWLSKYYDVSIGNSENRGFEKDSGILAFLYERREEENLYIEFETKRVEKKNIFNLPFMGYEIVPTCFSSLVPTLPSNLCILLSPKNECLPRYEIDLVFVYSDTSMYFFQGARQYVRKGWNEFVLGDKKKYTYGHLEYAKFDESDWKEYVQQQLKDSAQYIENTIQNFVNVVI